MYYLILSTAPEDGTMLSAAFSRWKLRHKEVM